MGATSTARNRGKQSSAGTPGRQLDEAASSTAAAAGGSGAGGSKAGGGSGSAWDERGNMALLVLLYMVQGIPLGLTTGAL